MLQCHKRDKLCMKKTTILPILFLSFFGLNSFAQDSLITKSAHKNVTVFTKEFQSFKGPGWDKILTQAKASPDVLIGEDHFTNETPYFTSALVSEIKFDNFFCEIDPFTARILQDKIKTLSAAALQKYVDNYGGTFSIYAFNPEFELLKELTKANTKIQGTDQILLIGDRLICNELKRSTKSKSAKALYEDIENNSKIYFENFLKDQSKPFYLLTDDFDKKVKELSGLKLSKEEQEIIAALQLSAKIYKSRSHHLRIQLMKNQLMGKLSEWQGKKNLFKYGANHLPKGESLLEIYDTGNLVNNIADSEFSSSLHLMILGTKGSQASPFKGFPDEKIDEQSSILKSLKPLLAAVDGTQWHCLDLSAIRKAIQEEKININDVTLSRIIKGYDLLVIVPTVSASKFIAP
jgi:hypothetical protein